MDPPQNFSSQAERDLIQRTLEAVWGNAAEAARLLKLSPKRVRGQLLNFGCGSAALCSPKEILLKENYGESNFLCS